MTMLKDPSKKYRAFPTIDLPDRTWPSKTITAAPIWCSSDLRDGNQSLIEPMDAVKKLRFWKTLVSVGVKEIEASFPAASQTDFDFVRTLIEGNHIPDDTTIQVLTQAREDLIARTFESLRGAKKAIVHLYNATSPSFRRIVFNQDKAGVKEIAVSAAKLFVKYAAQQPETKWQFEYSPETFSATELEFAKEVCDAVIEVWNATPQNKVILNLPATVEVATPNIYADQIEWFCRNITRRDSVLISLHTHNDRGCAVAATELGLMAGADRVEGTLFGNGERTGNVDIITLAMNMFSQGVDPKLDISNVNDLVRMAEYCNQLPIHPRHPYAGELVFTAFSGSHQDAIKKGFAAQKTSDNDVWRVPYLPLDPADVGCSYEAVIRVNSQSGKSGDAWLLEQNHGLKLPRGLQINFSKTVHRDTDSHGKEMSTSDIWRLFRQRYGLVEQPVVKLLSYDIRSDEQNVCHFNARIRYRNEEQHITGSGNGLLSGAVDALRRSYDVQLEIGDYHEHTLGHQSHSRAVAYVSCQGKLGETCYGVGIDSDVSSASLQALFNAASGILTD